MLLCPACKEGLVEGPETKSFETTEEHTLCENEDRPLRTVLICPCLACTASQKKVFWSLDGDGPYNTNFDEDFKWIDTNPYPFNSYHRAIYFSTSYKEEDNQFKNRWFMVQRDVRYASDKHGNKVGRRVRYSLWKYQKELGGYIHYISGLRMLIFSLSMFYKLPGGFKTRQAQDILNQAKWPRAEWWRKVAAWWIRTFHSELIEGQDG